MRIGVLAPAEIAIRRFMPALAASPGVEFAGVAVPSLGERFGSQPTETAAEQASIIAASKEKARQFTDTYGGEVYPSFAALLADTAIDAVYVPLPPALHAYWGNQVINSGKHLLLEKPFTTTAADTKALLAAAKARNLAVQENYMFAYHAQLAALANIVESGEIGDVRLIRIDFGFPRRAQNDFRYDKALGGGALLDAGGYPLRYAAMLLGPTARLVAAHLNYLDGFEVDMYGSAMLVNDAGTTVQLAFGMDNAYRCDVDIWGSKGSVRSDRILTAPAGFAPAATVSVQPDTRTVALPADDSFRNSIEYFLACIADPALRKARYQEIQGQADLVAAFVAAADITALVAAAETPARAGINATAERTQGEFNGTEGAAGGGAA